MLNQEKCEDCGKKCEDCECKKCEKCEGCGKKCEECKEYECSDCEKDFKDCKKMLRCCIMCKECKIFTYECCSETCNNLVCRPYKSSSHCYKCGDIYCCLCEEELYINLNRDLMIYYCNNCVPDYIKYEVEFEEMRRIRLQNALHKQGLELREDSTFCERYISKNDCSIKQVVRRMCEMKFLFEYQNMRRQMHNIQYELNQRERIPLMNVFDQAEANILESIKGYPRVFPWLEDKYIRICQKQVKKWMSKRNNAANVIQRNCHNWLYVAPEGIAYRLAKVRFESVIRLR